MQYYLTQLPNFSIYYVPTPNLPTYYLTRLFVPAKNQIFSTQNYLQVVMDTMS